MNTITIHYNDGEKGTFENAFIYAWADRVLVIHCDDGMKHIIPHKAYSLVTQVPKITGE